MAQLGDPAAIVVLDETAELKKGTQTVGVGRQHAGITGQVENCQTVVFMAYVTARAHALFDFRLYLPRAWCGDSKRRERAHVPEETQFTTKPALGTAMLTAAAAAGVPFAWVAADEVYGRGRKLREACEKDNKGYVFTVPVNFTVTLPSGRKTTVSRPAPDDPGRGVGDPLVRAGVQGPPRLRVGLGRHRLAPALDADPAQHRRPRRPGILLLPRARRPAGLAAHPEECLQQGKGQAGLDQHQVRTWHSFHRHTVLSMCAQALLAVAAARPAPAGAEPATAASQPAAWRDTGKLPATAGDGPPGDDPGLVKVSVPEIRRLARLATAPMSRATRDLGYAWSRWRRRHQARARWHHYHARLKAAHVT
ncbi:MAG TPA: transposase [Streptosporangiaceae bacterium]